MTKIQIDKSELERLFDRFVMSYRELAGMSKSIVAHCLPSDGIDESKIINRIMKRAISSAPRARKRDKRKNSDTVPGTRIRVSTIRKICAPRSARQNAIIFAVQRKQGRNPAFLRGADIKNLGMVAKRAIASNLRRPTGKQKLTDAIGVIGSYMERKIKSNIRRRVSYGGKMADVSPRTKRLKMMIYGKELPPMIFTGRLVASIRYRVSNG